MAYQEYCAIYQKVGKAPDARHNDSIVLAAYSKIEEAGIIIPVLAVTCDYKEMIRYEDQVRIEVTIDHYTGTRLEFSYHIYNQTTENLLTTGTSKHCFLDKETNRLLQLRRSHPEIHRIFSETFERQKETTND